MLRPYTNPQDFNDLPQDLHFVWRSAHVLKNSQLTSFSDPLSQQLLTIDCIKTILEHSLIDRGCSLSDFCFNLTCRLCLRTFKKLKLDAALLAYITHVIAKIQNSTATLHSSIEETKLLGKFPLPTEETLTACLKFYDKRPRIIGTIPHQVTGSLLLHSRPTGPHPLDRLQESSRRMAPSLNYQWPSPSDHDLRPPGFLLPTQEPNLYVDPQYDDLGPPSPDTPPLEPAYPSFPPPLDSARPLHLFPPGMSVKRQREQ